MVCIFFSCVVVYFFRSISLNDRSGSAKRMTFKSVFRKRLFEVTDLDGLDWM